MNSHAVYTRKTIWKNWLDMPLNVLGIAIRVQRLKKRRGKSDAWAKKRLLADVKKHRHYQQTQSAMMNEIYEQMQKGILQGEHDHDHDEHGHTSEPTDGEQPGDTDR